MTLEAEHAHAIASAISDYMSAQHIRYADKPKACEAAYKELVDRIEAALTLARIGQVNG